MMHMAEDVLLKRKCLRTLSGVLEVTHLCKGFHGNVALVCHHCHVSEPHVLFWQFVSLFSLWRCYFCVVFQQMFKVNGTSCVFGENEGVLITAVESIVHNVWSVVI